MIHEILQDSPWLREYWVLIGYQITNVKFLQHSRKIARYMVPYPYIIIPLNCVCGCSHIHTLHTHYTNYTTHTYTLHTNIHMHTIRTYTSHTHKYTHHIDTHTHACICTYTPTFSACLYLLTYMLMRSGNTQTMEWSPYQLRAITAPRHRDACSQNCWHHTPEDKPL